MEILQVKKYNSSLLHSPLAKIKGGLGLRFIERRGGATDDYSGSCIASKRLLEDTSQLGISVRDVSLGGVSEGGDHVTQSRQGLVDVLGLIQH